VVQLDGSAQLPAVDGSQLTGISATVAALNDIGDVSAASPNNGDVIAYNSTSGDWEAAAQGISAISVTVSSPSTDQTLSAPSGIEELYIYTPSVAITVNLVAAATCGSGYKYNIKNRSTNTITIDPDGSEAIDGSSTFALSTQNASVTLITDGSNWFII
jgi:cytoskeletal protein RodZ